MSSKFLELSQFMGGGGERIIRDFWAGCNNSLDVTYLELKFELNLFRGRKTITYFSIQNKGIGKITSEKFILVKCTKSSILGFVSLLILLGIIKAFP